MGSEKGLTAKEAIEIGWGKWKWKGSGHQGCTSNSRALEDNRACANVNLIEINNVR